MQTLIVLLLLSQRQFFDEEIPGLRYEDREESSYEYFEEVEKEEIIPLDFYDCEIEDCEDA